jgi:hypothetical protein
VVFNPDHPIPDAFTLGGAEYPTLDGDKHDLRFLDPPGHIVALKGKRIAGGKERAIESGFYRTVKLPGGSGWGETEVTRAVVERMIRER